MSRAPWNPFYSGPASPPPGPPSYNASTRPVPPVPAEPVSYTSLSDLTKGKQQQAPPASSFNYQPSSQRAGYREEGFTSGGGFGGGAGPSQPNQGGPAQGTRRLPPDPTAHRDKTLLPPKRNVPATSSVPQAGPGGATTAAAANQSYWQKAQGYVPNTVSATASTAGDKVKSGVDSVFTQQNRDAAMGGLAKAAGGAAKLAAQGAWKLGKFASSGGKST